MNTLVLDAPVALKSLLPKEQHHDSAFALLMEFQSHLPELIAPDILPAEMGHALMKAPPATAPNPHRIRFVGHKLVLQNRHPKTGCAAQKFLHREQQKESLRSTVFLPEATRLQTRRHPDWNRQDARTH